MSTDLRAIMRYRQQVHNMIRDPDLNGHLLLLALCMVDALYERKVAGRSSKAMWSEVEKLVWGQQSARGYYGSLWSTIRKDVPKYVPAEPASHGCVAPMIRREGLCGKSPYTSFVDRDPETGEGAHVAYCTRHWSHEREMERRRRILEWEANGSPMPPANAGGVLRRYFTTDWDALYAWADSMYDPNLAGGKAATRPRPVFTLIQGGDES